jgi:asparagine synthase (glutamine-hydrolysing)
VRTRLRCHTAPASMLSGGLDSSTIVALARDLLAAQGRGPLRTYSGLSPEGAGCPETRAVLAVIARGGLRATCLRPGNMDEHAQALLAALEAMEDPFDGGWALLSLMFLHTAGDGGRVLLSGVDGEHALGAPTGYIRYLLREGRLRAGWREAQGFSTHYYRGCYSPLRLYLQALRSALVPAPLRRVKQWLGAPWRYRALLARSPISPELARRADLAGRFARYQQYLANNSGEGLQAWHQHIMQVPYLIAGIERYERLASYFGVEVRHPLLDTRLLAFSAALPLAQKVRGGWSKFLLRRLAAGRLPAEVAWREGWEELGWQFEARLAQWLGRGQDFPMLGFYLDQWLRRCGCAGGEAGAKIAAAQNLAEKPVT